MQFNSTRTATSIFRASSGCSIAFILALWFIASPIYSQIKISPLEKHAPRSKHMRKNAKTKPDTLKLPFWDDFSFTPVDDPTDTTSNFPLDSIWEYSNTTWISTATAIHAPTYNTAVLDGVDSLGHSYSDVVLANGYRDKLQSRPIDLGPSQVSGAEKNTVFLSFFYEMKGHGEPPDTHDYLEVDFRHANGDWETMMQIYPDLLTKSYDVFYDTIIQVTDPYLYKGFQFRFRTFGRQSGPFDTWIIDYVFLNKNRSVNDNSFDDTAIASTIAPIFGRYQAIPLKHFLNYNLYDTTSFDIQNLQDKEESKNYSIDATFVSYKDGVSNATNATICPSTGVKEGSTGGGDVTPFERVHVLATCIPSDIYSLFDNTADSVDIDYHVNLQSTDGDDYPFFDLSVNNKVSKSYHLSSYYAYDDGSAEYSGELTQAGNKLLYAFDIDTTSTKQLVGFDVYFPPFKLTEGVRTDFYVYSATNSGAPKDLLYTIPNRAIERLKQNKFQRIVISENENVFVERRFFIGWRAPSGDPLHFGIDYSNDTGDLIYTNTTSDAWEASDVIDGSLMIHPLFGAGIGTPTGIQKENVVLPMYPNPTRGEFYLEGRAKVTSIINMRGQQIPYSVTDAGAERQRILLHDTPPGLYVVKIQKGTSQIAQKIIVR